MSLGRSNLGKALTVKAAKVRALMGNSYSSEEESTPTPRLSASEKKRMEEKRAMKTMAAGATPIGKKKDLEPSKLCSAEGPKTMTDYFPTTSRQTSSASGSVKTTMTSREKATVSTPTTQNLLKDMTQMVEEIERSPGNKRNITNPTPSKEKRQRDRESNLSFPERTVAESVTVSYTHLTLPTNREV